MSRALLDVNVLLALLDSDHASHDLARIWLRSEIDHGWASCALTQNGFLRIVTQPRYPSPVEIGEATHRLVRATETEFHRFWPCNISLLDAGWADPSQIQGPRQLTDVYLLALAVEHGGRFVTFDRSIPLHAVPRAAADDLVVLA